MARALLWTGLALAGLAGLACDPEAADAGDAPAIGDPEYDRDPALDVELVSERGGQASHAAGDNCLHCHQAFGPGPGRFTVAGTVYGGDGEVSPDAIVELWTGAAGMGELRLSVEADALGNFYTTEAIDFFGAEPLFPYVRSADGARVNLMPFPTKSGACNVCHVGGFVVRL